MTTTTEKAPHAGQGEGAGIAHEHGGSMENVALTTCECEVRLYSAEMELFRRAKARPDLCSAYAMAACLVKKERFKHVDHCAQCQAAEEIVEAARAVERGC